MAYEIGGRADKYGNRFELNWIIKKILDVLEERITSITIEALGEAEIGVDLWIKDKDGHSEAQQCKGRNGSQEFWDYGSLNALNIWNKWKYQLERQKTTTVALVTPLSFSLFEELIEANSGASPYGFAIVLQESNEG